MTIEQVTSAYAEQLRAMDAGDTTALRALFTPDAVLVHMTGYRQPLDEWMAGMDAREFVYHRIEEHSLDVDPLDPRDPQHAHLVSRITTGITDDGSGRAWPLRVEQDYVRRDGRWLVQTSRVTFDAARD